MRYKTKLLLLLFSLTIIVSSCESDAERKQRLAKVEQQRNELEEKRKAEEAERVFQLEQERVANEARLEKERQEKVIYDKYIDNSLSTGATPYSRYYGSNSTCNEYGCSQIKVRTSNSDVVVTIKKNGNVRN